MRYLHIGFTTSGKPPVATLQKLFDEAQDWMRYAPGTWVLWTDREKDWWTDKIFELDQTSKFVIFEIDPKSRWGRNDKWVWDWIDNNPPRR